MSEKTIPPKKEFYTVKTEVMVPMVLCYRILAESPEEAAEIAKKLGGQKQSVAPLIHYHKLRLLKATVYDAGTIVVRFARSFL